MFLINFYQKNVKFDLISNLCKKEEKDITLFYSPNIINFKDFRQINGLLDPSFENNNSGLYFINSFSKIKNIKSETNENDANIEKDKKF